MSPNYLPVAPRYARTKDLGLQNQMRRALNDRYMHGAVWDMNPHGAVWDLDPRPQPRYRSEFPPAPDEWLEALEMLELEDDEEGDNYGSASYGEDAPEKKKPFQKFKEAVFKLAQKKEAGAGAGVVEKAKEEVKKAREQVQELVAPRPQPPIIIHTPAQERQDTTKTILVAAGVAAAAFGAGWYLGSRSR
jgi:hypothetical protein